MGQSGSYGFANETVNTNEPFLGTGLATAISTGLSTTPIAAPPIAVSPGEPSSMTRIVGILSRACESRSRRR
jgi:hypothetical protein